MFAVLNMFAVSLKNKQLKLEEQQETWQEEEEGYMLTDNANVNTATHAVMCVCLTAGTCEAH